MRVRFSLCSAAFLLCGCYTTVPIEVAKVQPGMKLRMSLTDAGSDSLARYLGPGVQVVDGKLLQSTDSGVSLAVSQVTMRSGIDQFWKGETVMLPKYSLATVQERKLSKSHTLFLSGAIIAVLATVKLSGVGSGNSSSGGGPPPPPR